MCARKALLLVDVQNDFCPNGALAVPEGDSIISILNQYIQKFSQNSFPVFASRDWHPVTTHHFKEFGGPWPAHCVENTRGAAFHPSLDLPENIIVFSKGMREGQDGYSAFEGVDDQGICLFDLLKQQDVEEIFIGGLATDYCVKASCLDAVKQGLKVYLLIDGIKGVNIHPDDSKEAIDEMVDRGVELLCFEECVFS